MSPSQPASNRPPVSGPAIESSPGRSSVTFFRALGSGLAIAGAAAMAVVGAAPVLAWLALGGAVMAATSGIDAMKRAPLPEGAATSRLGMALETIGAVMNSVSLASLLSLTAGTAIGGPAGTLVAVAALSTGGLAAGEVGDFLRTRRERQTSHNRLN